MVASFYLEGMTKGHMLRTEGLGAEAKISVFWSVLRLPPVEVLIFRFLLLSQPGTGRINDPRWWTFPCGRQ